LYYYYVYGGIAQLIPSVTGYMLGDGGIVVRFPVKTRQDVQTGCGPHPASYSMGTNVSFLGGVMRPRRQANTSPPSSEEFKNDWNSTSTPPYAIMACIITILQFI
jgi:hypothetical protein